MNYKLTISYNGSKYHGWAPQPNIRTIYSEFEKVLLELFDEKPIINASGRTDAGVHALKQVINFNLKKSIDSFELLKAINSKLPRDIRVIDSIVVDDRFHARYFAKNKTYMYVIDCNENFNPIFESVLYQYNKNVDLKKINDVKELLIGRKNFLSFSTSEYEVEKCYRTIYSINCEYKNNFLIIKICGDGFLRSMVRMIVGSFLAYNENKINLEHISYLLNNPQKGKSIYKVPSCGLYLYEVKYED